MFERKWAEISATPLTVDGTVNGEVYVASTIGFKAKQRVILRSSTQPDENFEIKRVLSKTKLLVGVAGRPIDSYSDISAFLTADAATIEAPEQNRPAIPEKEYERAVYEEEPTVAKRVTLVDDFGDKYNNSNPLPVKVSGSGTPGETDFPTVSTPTIQNIVLPNKNTEYTITIPAETYRFTLKTRKDAVLQASYTSGQTATLFFTIGYGMWYNEDSLDGTGITLYVRSNKDGTVVELLSWA